jgi:hypothetical protein
MSNITAQASIYWVDRFFRNSGLSKAIKLFAVTSNILDKPGDEIITWHRDRCGKSD